MLFLLQRSLIEQCRRIHIPPLAASKVTRSDQLWSLTSDERVGSSSIEFPDRSDDSLIPLSFIARARERTLPAEGEALLGVDVARRGSSETVIVLRRGGVARCVHARVGDDTMRTAGEVIQALRPHRAVMAKVDDVGVGGGRG